MTERSAMNTEEIRERAEKATGEACPERCISDEPCRIPGGPFDSCSRVPATKEDKLSERLSHASGALSDIQTIVTSCVHVQADPEVHKIAEAVLGRILSSAHELHHPPSWYRHDWERRLWEEYLSGKTPACSHTLSCQKVAADLVTGKPGDCEKCCGTGTSYATLRAKLDEAVKILKTLKLGISGANLRRVNTFIKQAERA